MTNLEDCGSLFNISYQWNSVFCHRIYTKVYQLYLEDDVIITFTYGIVLFNNETAPWRVT